MNEQADFSASPATGWRSKLGPAMFGLSILVPLAGVPLATTLGLSAGVTASVTGDILLLASLFVLGGDFWGKVRSLFIHHAEVRFAQVA